MGLYRKVIIKSEDDLPKKSGYYTIHPKQTSKWHTETFRYEKGDNVYWLRVIDWYLEPIELPSGEEIEKWAMKQTSRVSSQTILVFGAKWMRDKIINQK